jgi:phosphoesterase RecJ-like protein
MISRRAHELFREQVERASEIVVTTHINPDGDGLGSQLGLARFLLARGKQVRLINHDPTPEVLRILDSDDLPVETYAPEVHDDVLRSCDLVVLVDNSAPDRMGRMERIMVEVAGHTLCIDHHPSRDTPWARLILDEAACATAVIVYDLVRDAGWVPDRLAALALYVGLATDTGFFRFNSTDEQAYRAAADFLRLGVDPSRVYQAIYERNSVAYTRLLGHALTGVRVDQGAVASVVITRELVESLDAGDVDTSEITTPLLAMDGIAVALLFRELADGRVKVSLRSKGALDVHRLAGEFGGGGHRNASGIVMDGALDDVVGAVIRRAAAMLPG